MKTGIHLIEGVKPIMKDEKKVEQAREFAIRAHGPQMYGDQPYVYHLDHVATLLKRYGSEAQIIAYLHDVVEDTQVTCAEIEAEFGEFVGECVRLISDESGHTRAERKLKTNAKLQDVSGREELALIVKVADRLANIRCCIAEEQTERLARYIQEHDAFAMAVYRRDICEQFWEELSRLVVLR